MAQNFSKARELEKIGARMMERIYAIFQRPVTSVVAQRDESHTYPTNGRLLDEDHRFISRDLQRKGLDYAFAVDPCGGSRYRLVEEKTDQYYKTGNFAFEELTLSDTDITVNWTHTSRAGFVIYIFPVSRDIYFIPLEPARAYIEANRERFETASVPNYRYLTFCTLVPISELLEAIPSILHIHADWFDDITILAPHKLKKFPKSKLPLEHRSRSITLEDLRNSVTGLMPEKRRGGPPELGVPELLRLMTLKDKQRKNNAAHYARYGLFNLVRDLLPANRFGFKVFSAHELARAVVQADEEDICPINEGIADVLG